MIHIRRVAGLPGEKVQIKNGKLYIIWRRTERKV
ncbi:MAG: S26 family signal peptidase [Eubacterium sp.]